MSIIPRKRSEADIYHVMNRGVGRCIIFEDDGDRAKFLDLLANVVEASCTRLHAWCLMDNHYHLLISVPYDDLPKIMQLLDAQYATYFNARHKRDGRLFSGPYVSEPIESDEHFLVVLRYIHRNPVKAGMTATCDYAWSSYREYLGRARLINPELAMSLLSDEEGFLVFHEIDDESCSCIDIGDDRAPHLLSDKQVLELAQSILPGCSIENLAGLPRVQRDEAIRTLEEAHLSIRQISRLTGIPKSTIARA